MGLVGVLAGVFFALAIVLLVVFFIVHSTLADRLSSCAFLALEGLMVPVVLEVHRRFVAQTPLTWVATVVCLAGLAILLVTGVAVLLGRVTFARVSYLQTGGFALAAAWTAATSGLSLAFGGFAAALGWLGIGTVVVGLASIGWIARDPAVVQGDQMPGPVALAVGMASFVAMAAWLVWPGASL